MKAFLVRFASGAALLASSVCLQATALVELTVATTCWSSGDDQFCNSHGELTGIRGQALPSSLANLSIFTVPLPTSIFDEETITATPEMITSIQLSFNPRVDESVARISVNDSLFDAPNHPQLSARTGFINAAIMIDSGQLELTLGSALRSGEGEKVTSSNPTDYISSFVRTLAVLIIR